MVMAIAVLQPALAQEDETAETVRVDRGDLSVTFRDNSKSPGELSGIDALLNTKDAADFDAYDPDTIGASAGLNFEHIISGHANSNNKFTPRHGTYRLHRMPGDGRVVLCACSTREFLGGQILC
jgi:hypothetical protein